MLRFVIILITFFIGVISQASPAYPFKTSIILQDGDTMLVSIKGDEHCKYAITEDSITIIQQNNVWYYAEVDSVGNAIPSMYAVQSKKKESKDLISFLSKQPKGITPSINTRLDKNDIQKSSSEGTSAVVGERRVLVVLMAFQDRDFYFDKDYFEDLFNKESYSYDGAQGSVYDYFNEASYGKLSLKGSIFGPYKSRYSMSYYGANLSNGNDRNPKALFLEAIENVAAETNLSVFDCNNDGYLDNIHIIYAGYGEEAGAVSDAIWAHKMGFPDINIQGVKINCYSCSSELRGNSGYGITRIGPCCHEIGHALGTLDFYDTDYSSGGNFEGTGKWDIMASGSWNNGGITPPHFNPYTKVFDFGWCDIQDLEDGCEYSIAPSNREDNQIYRISTTSEGDFYLVENRSKEGFDSYIYDSGLMIYHVHPNIDKTSKTNTINASYPQMMYPVCASSDYSVPNSNPISYGNVNSDGCPFPGSSNNRSFGYSTTPAFFSWAGEEQDIYISDIEYSENIASFKVSNQGSSDDYDEEDTWKESFEKRNWSENWRVLSNSTILYGWNRDSITSGSDFAIIGKPKTVPDGNYFLSLKKQSLLLKGIDSTNSYYASEIMATNSVDINGIPHNLSFKYQIQSQSSSSRLGVNVYDETDNIILTKEFSGTGYDWESASLSLPVISGTLRISLLGDLKDNGSIYVDDMVVSKLVYAGVENIQNDIEDYNYNVQGNALNVSLSQPKMVMLYSLDGSMIYTNCAKYHHVTLSSGIYLLRIENNVHKFIIP